MKTATTLILLLLILSSCKKSVVKTYPNIVGEWSWVNWCVIGNNFKKLTVNTNGKGKFDSYDSNSGVGETSEGKVKTNDDDLYVDGNYVFTIIEVIDTLGYIQNPNPPSFCSNDLIYVRGLLRVKVNNGSNQTYYKIN
ncbi:MAG: hypothetical protein COA33_005175 [Fluviicola sp.]|nr:hypothetical protein [Fluviicola sp.]